MEDAFTPAIIMVVIGVVMAVIGALGWARKLPANAMIGIRLPATTASDETWEVSHVVAGPWLVLAGIVPLVVGSLLMAFDTQMPDWTILAAYGAMAVLVGVGAVRGVRAANALTGTSL